MKLQALAVLSILAISNGQNCKNHKDQNEQPQVWEYKPATTQVPDPNWPGMVGGGYWTSDDFPKDPRYETVDTVSVRVANQNFTWLNKPPVPYFYIDWKDPKGQEKFDTLWKNQTIEEKLQDKPNVRPAGYKYAFIHSFNKKIPCIRVQGAKGRGLEIAVYAEEDHRICIRDIRNADKTAVNKQASVAFTTVCGQQRVKHCFVTPSDEDVNFEIYADTPYELTNGFGVFYRMRRSQHAYVTSGNNLRSESTEMWCMMLDGIDWPEFTATTPDGLDIPRTGGATRVDLVSVVVVAGAAALFAVGW